ncbi:flagellin [Agaribacterium sp. ZY112]|uniref:flagellin N-terminal helical domain-containing protein n=1 Tax=Agaribacterium sp. ZY112 TaxID=3233574 RepID=UPI0035267132
MPLVVNSNIASLNAQRQLMSSGGELDKASERLASGKRINSAADDAAGLAISNRQTSAIRGLDQAIRNANDGVSLIQTAEGALDETTNILQRMRELSVQSANGIYSDTDRASLNAESQQLIAEIDRIAETTSFNGQNILDGSQGDVALQVGSNANQTITFSIGELDANSLGGSAGGDIVGSAVDLVGITLADDVTINGQTIDDADLEAATNVDEFLAVLNDGVSGVDFTATTRFEAATVGTGVLRGGDTMEIDTVNADGTATSLVITDTGNLDELVAAINEKGGDDISASLSDSGKLVIESASGAQITVGTAATAEQDAVGTGGAATVQEAQLSLTSTDGNEITVAYADATDADDLGINARAEGGILSSSATLLDADATVLLEGQLVINGVEIGAADGTAVADIIAAINDKAPETGVVASGATAQVLQLNSVDNSAISIEAGTTTGADALLTALHLVETNTSATSGDSVSDIDISTEAGAQSAIDVIDTALEQISTTRSELGAVNNRLDFTVSNLSNVSEKTSAARSRIVDADFAAETANLSRAQVLQQASQAMLAQANARPQQVLSLLQ